MKTVKVTLMLDVENLGKLLKAARRKAAASGESAAEMDSYLTPDNPASAVAVLLNRKMDFKVPGCKGSWDANTVDTGDDDETH